MTRSRTLQITFTALFAAIIAVLTIIPLPFHFLGVPMTLQTFAVAFCGFMIGWKLGLGSVGIYIFMGAIGIPVFSNMQGGFQKLIGPTGGFIYGFLIILPPLRRSATGRRERHQRSRRPERRLSPLPAQGHCFRGAGLRARPSHSPPAPL